MQNAPADSAAKLLGRIQSGMNAPMRQTKMLYKKVSAVHAFGMRGTYTMVKRRPMYWLTQPATPPPL